MPQENHLIRNLKNIKAKLKSQEMSVMVGAGFSKNVNNTLYPSWWELLADMVKHLEGKKFSEEYKRIKPTSKRPGLKEFIEDRITDYIRETGSLKVASKYMELLGYRESIDSYIEKRTPYIVNRDNEKYLRHFVNDTSQDILLTDEDLSAHRKLVNLPWNNIYTTNYDNLLEKCIDEKIESQILTQIDTLDIALKELDEEKITNIRKQEEVEIELSKFLDEQESDRKPSTGAGIAVELSYTTDESIQFSKLDGEETSPYRELSVKLSQLKSENKFLDRQLVIKEKELSKLKLLLKACPSVVIRSSQLALKRTRNIIKLHGSRRTEENAIFGFDDDARKQYVITQEDFDGYPLKHEAFTQLMRISLLQESFCLIGFSGEDPNFLAWIGWVRDVLFKDDKWKSTDSNEKIYLISPSTLPPKNSPDYGKTTFYENRRIASIPLLEEDCIDFLERETGKKLEDKTSRKGILKLFFDYLQIETVIPGPELAVEVSYRTKFNQLCEGLPYWNTKIDIENITGIVERLSPIKHLVKYNRFPSVLFPYDQSRQRFIQQASVYIELIKHDHNLSDIYLNAVCTFISVQLYPHSLIFNEDPTIFKKMRDLAKDISPQLYGRFMLLDIKDAVWRDDQRLFDEVEKTLMKIDDPEINQERQYFKALHLLLQLKFSDLKSCLSLWDATGHWIVRKAGLLSHLDTNVGRALLLKNDVKIIQEHLYELELAGYLDYSISQYGESPANERYKYLKGAGLNTISESADYLLEEIKEKGNKILPYGEDRNTINTGFTLSNTNKYWQSTQFIGLMMESGYPFSTDGSSFRLPQKVYAAFANTLLLYWFPAIQGALQFSDPKFLKRIAQDFIFTTDDTLVFGAARGYLQAAYLNHETPKRYKNNIIVFLAELINVEDPIIWEPFLLKVWKENLNQITSGRNHRNRRTDYLNKGIKLIQGPSIISKIVNDCLDAVNREISLDILIQYLFELASNPYLRLNVASVRNSISKSLPKVIDQIGKTPNILFLMGNLEPLLNKKDKELIFNQMINFDFSKITSVRLWRVALFFVKEDMKLINKIKKAILINNHLWDAGFTEKGVTRGDYIGLHALRKRGRFQGLSWSKLEVAKIYQKLVAEFEKIKKHLKRHPGTGIFNDILEEMVSFLKDEETHLLQAADFLKINQEINYTLNNQREFDSPLKGIISDEQNKVLWALDEIVSSMYENHDWLPSQVHLEVLVNKVLLQKAPAVEACLNRLSFLVFEFQKNENLKAYRRSLIAILTQYKDHPLETGDQPYIQEQLVRIAYVLFSWRIEDEIVIDYLNLLENSRFNNVKYNLRNTLLVNEES